MNIFILDINTYEAAQFHCDEHLGKMITESVQLLSTQIHSMVLSEYFDDLFASSHISHPSRLWISESFENFEYLLDLASCLHLRYVRYTEMINKEVKYQRENRILNSLYDDIHNQYHNHHIREEYDSNSKLTNPLLAMPEEIATKYGTPDKVHLVKKGQKTRIRANNLDSAVNAYREYYCSKVFKNGKTPKFSKSNTTPLWYNAPTLKNALEEVEL